MKKIIVSLLIGASALFSAGLTLPSATNPTTNNEPTIDISGVVESMPKIVGSDLLALPKTKENYTPQIHSFNPKTGEITFKIYDNARERFLADTVSYNSYTFEKELKVEPEKLKAIDNIVKKRQAQLESRSNKSVSQYYKDMEAYKTQLKDSSRTGSNYSSIKEFLTLSKFAVACVTLDNTIIDIEKSMQTKEMVLQPRYTMNLNEAMSYTQARQSTTLIDDKLQEYVKKFSIKTFFFVLEWQKENSLLIQKIKMFLMTIFLPLTIGYTGLSKLTKKLQKISDFDDIAEKGSLMIIAFMLFFMNQTTYQENASNKDIGFSQTAFQKWGVDAVRTSVGFADEMTINTVSSYSQWQMNNLGAMSEKDLLGVYTSQEKTEKLYRLYDKIYHERCLGDYVINKLIEVNSYMKNSDTVFFSDEQFRRAMVNWNQQAGQMESSIFPWGNRTQFWRKETMPTLSLSACSQLEKEIRVLRQDREQYEEFNKKLEAMKDIDISKDVELLTTLSKDGLTYAKHLGFIYAPYVLLQDYFIRNLSHEESALNNVHRNERFKSFEEDKFNSSVTQWLKEQNMPNFAEWNDKAGETMVEIIKALPYKIIPSFKPIHDAVYDPLHIMVGGIPTELGVSFLGFGVEGDVGVGVRATADLIAYMTGYKIAYEVTLSTLEFAPAFLMIVAGLWVVVFYLISLFIYFFVSPFILAYALGSQQTEALRSFITRGVVLALKPIKLVLSIVVTLVALDLTLEMLNFTKDVIIQNLISSYSVSGWMFIMFTFFQGLFHVIALVVTAIMAFTLVFKGADMILALFGFKEGGVDTKEIVGGDIEGKSDRYKTVT